MKQTTLMYHDVYDTSIDESGFQTPSAEHYKVQIKEFTKQIRTISEYCELKNISKEKVLLTFDDGGSSFYSVIAPILLKYGFKGYFFITTSFIDTKRFLSTAEIISLHEKGHFIGTHSHTHPARLNNLPLDALEDEWSHSIKMLENILHTKIRYASIPGGSYSRTVGHILEAIGIKYIFTSKPTTKIQYLSSNCKVIGRFAIINTTTISEVINLFIPVSFIRFKQTMKWNLLAILKSLLGDNYLNIRKYILK